MQGFRHLFLVTLFFGILFLLVVPPHLTVSCLGWVCMFGLFSGGICARVLRTTVFIIPWHTQKAAMGHVQHTPAPPTMHLIFPSPIPNHIPLTRISNTLTFIKLLLPILFPILTPINPPIISMLPPLLLLLLLYIPTPIHSLPKARIILLKRCPMLSIRTTMAGDR